MLCTAHRAVECNVLSGCLEGPQILDMYFISISKILQLYLFNILAIEAS